MTKPMLGVTLGKTGADFRLWSHHASLVELCLFDSPTDEREAHRIGFQLSEMVKKTSPA